jgi:sec-independent protein translocase protein TatC
VSDSVENPQPQTLVQHLAELRSRLIICVVTVLVGLLALYPFANELYHYLAQPLLRHLPEGGSMIATDVASPFLTPFKLALVAAVFITIPVLLYQIWAFVAPGLYKHEKRLVFPLLFMSVILFYLGAMFAYFVVFPLVFGFFTAVAPEGVAVMTDISRYLDFVLKLFFAFGVVFEVPVVTILLVRTGFTTPESLVQKRPYIIVAAFVVGMLLTPPDVFSQTLLAIPMWLLFELGVWLSRLESFGGKREPLSVDE